MATAPTQIEPVGGGRVPPPVGRAARARARRGAGAGSLVTPYLFLAPYLLLFTVFIFLPALYGIWVSLHNWDFLLPGKPFVGFENYAELLNPNSVNFDPFWNSMIATGKFTLYSVPLLIVAPLMVALILNQKFKGRNFFRAVYFAPYVLGGAVIGVLFAFLLDPSIGIVNFYLEKLGFRENIPWTTDVPWAYWSLVVATVWWTLGFNAVIFLAGVQDIPAELYEAAKVDGAGRFSRFRNVTLPGLRPVLLFVIVITILASANVFAQPFLITEGQPGQETRSAIMYIAEKGLREFQMGAAAAMSFILAFFLLIISVLNFAFFRERG